MKAPINLGPEVKVDIQKLGNNPFATKRLNDIAETMTPLGLKHVASYAVHIYTQQSDLQSPECAVLCQLSDLPALVSEEIAQNSLRILGANLLAKFGHRQRHNDKKVTGQENLG